MPGVPDPLYVQARRVLLDATDALAEQLDAIVLVGAQAIYLHTGDADLAVDLMVPDSLAGPGSRGARLGHPRQARCSTSEGPRRRSRRP